MYITLGPTEKYWNPEHSEPVVSIALPDDTMILADIIEYLVKPALIAFGFAEETVDEAFSETENATKAARWEFGNDETEQVIENQKE